VTEGSRWKKMRMPAGVVPSTVPTGWPSRFCSVMSAEKMLVDES